MTERHPEAPPQCFSYSAATLERCLLPAGHDGEHEVVRYTRWDDEGAWSPEKLLTTPSPILQVHPGIPLAPEDLVQPTDLLDVDQDQPDESGCYNCPHPAHEEACTFLVTSQQVECGCTFRSI